ncbi:MAG TPA: hypothetical protein VGL81_34535 [Polyangiaceae bacterium]|jgi:hypothetical protein
MTIKIIVLAIWAAVHPGAPRLPDAAPIAAAIDTAVSEDSEPPVFGSREEDAAVMAYYAIRESWLTHDAVGDGGLSFGAWQIRSPSGRADIGTQARYWLSLLHEGARICPASPAAPLSGGCVEARSTADGRARRARRLLESAKKALARAAS